MISPTSSPSVLGLPACTAPARLQEEQALRKRKQTVAQACTEARHAGLPFPRLFPMSMARWLLYIQIASISHTKFMRDAHYSTSFLVLCCGHVLVEIGAQAILVDES